MNLKEFVSVISELLEHTTFYVSDNLGWGSVDCGEAFSITDDGKLLGDDEEVIFDFSDWDNEDDEPGEISAINQYSIEVCYNYRLIKLVMPEYKQHKGFDIIKHLLKNVWY